MQSLERAFHILTLVSAHPLGVRFSDVAHLSGLPQGTVGRLLAALEKIGAVERLPTGKGYRIGNSLVALSEGVSFERQLRVTARPYLLELAQATEETVNLGLYSGRQALFVDQIDSTFELRTQDYTSMRYPLHVVSTGKVFLAYFSEGQLDAYLETPLAPYTEQTITDAEILRKQLPTVRAQGYVETVSEAEEGLSAYAAPVFSKEGDKVIAAVSVTAPTFRVNVGDKKERIVTQLKTCCQRLSALLSRAESAEL